MRQAEQPCCLPLSSQRANPTYLLVLQVRGELIALREGARALDGLLLGLLAQDGGRVL